MNPPLLIATAGHVDHGKSTLIKALTGTDPDRFAEEKARGITIDLGYAHCRDGDREYSFVDVPGHEKFIHNMLAGIGSIDGVLFVIAADESVMPQTREHATALRYLGVENVLVVITKIDLVDEDLLALLEEELDEWLDSMGWSGAPRVHFSSQKPETTATVREALGELNKRPALAGSGFRMSIDRVFTSTGSGTVVTGTVDRGDLAKSDAVILAPDEKKCRIRAIQVHGQPAEGAGSHMRVALNLGDIHYTAIHRGDLIFRQPMETQPAKRTLVRLELFETDWSPSPKHSFHLHHLAAHRMARVIWFAPPYAVLEVDQPYPFWALDRGLLRDGSPLRVHAGFEVLLPAMAKSRPKQLVTLLANPPGEDLLSWQQWFCRIHPDLVTDVAVRTACGEPLMEEPKQGLKDLGKGQYVTPATWDKAYNALLEVLAQCHRDSPIFSTLPISRIKARFSEFRAWQPLVEALFKAAEREGDIEVTGDKVQVRGHSPIWTPRQKRLLDEMIEAMATGPLAVLELRQVDSNDKQNQMILDLLLWEGYLLPLSTDLLIRHDALNELIQKLHYNHQGETFAVGDLKEHFGLTRKLAIPLLEYLDKIGCTRRLQEGRLWVAKSPPRFTCGWQLPT